MKYLTCYIRRYAALSVAAWLLAAPLSAQKTKMPPLILRGENGKLTYVADSLGNRVPDYSYCGYRLSDEPVPWVENRVFVPCQEGDATLTIQTAIDRVASLPADADGFRGAVLLDKGTFALDGSLRIDVSGVVLRGMGSGEDGTVLLGRGVTRETLVVIGGRNDRTDGKPLKITDRYVPVNASALTVDDASVLRAGDRVRVRRFSTEKWIEAIGCDEFGGGLHTMTWIPGDKDLYFDRTVVAVDGNRITLDAPLTNAIEQEYGGGEVIPYRWEGRISNVGIEGMALVSEYDRTNPKDENHRWVALDFRHAENAWARQLAFRHFAGGAVFVQNGASKITVEDCISTEPVSEIGGFRRYTFYSMGQQVLFQRCFSVNGYHDFAVGQCATGPMAFVQCESVDPYSFSGGVASWATGILFDVTSVEGGIISFKNRGQDGNGAGWNAANSLLWNTTAAKIDCYKPATAQNWSMGCWAKYSGDGYWYEIDANIQPLSLFYAQLADRLGRDVSEQARILPRDTKESTSPTVEKAAELIAWSVKPALRMSEWIAQAKMPTRALDRTGAKVCPWIMEDRGPAPIVHPLTVADGKLVRDGKLLTGKEIEGRIWAGSLNPSYANTVGPHLTRFVPGRDGQGFTDDLDSVAIRMRESGAVTFYHQPSLWYERRRDDHERVKREDGDVWAPFYEQPYARSGQGTAWDGLSKYDLTKYNPWYFERLREFAARADRNGLVLKNEHYLQHNILEAGAHWAEYPWRSANNVNETGFPEPVPYAGNKRVFMAEQFYDVAHARRAAIHRAYFRHHLDNFPENAGVLHSLSGEYTGPLHFMRFWLDAIGEWQQEKGRDVNVMLSATKDVEDAVLADPKRAALVDVIDIQYWFYRADGSLYAPKGGLNLSPRQHARQVAPGETSAAQVYRAVKEYRDRYPNKAVIYSAAGAREYPWAVLIAGGSLPVVPQVDDPGFAAAAARMKPGGTASDAFPVAGAEGEGYLGCPLGDGTIGVNVPKGRYERLVIDAKTGKIVSRKRVNVSGEMAELPMNVGTVVWLKR